MDEDTMAYMIEEVLEDSSWHDLVFKKGGPVHGDGTYWVGVHRYFSYRSPRTQDIIWCGYYKGIDSLFTYEKYPHFLRFEIACKRVNNEDRFKNLVRSAGYHVPKDTPPQNNKVIQILHPMPRDEFEAASDQREITRDFVEAMYRLHKLSNE